MPEAKFMKYLRMGKEERDNLYREEELKEAFNNAKDQAKVDIREVNGKIRNYKAQLREQDKDIKTFRVGKVADNQLQLKAEEENLAEMKAVYKEYFGEDFIE